MPRFKPYIPSPQERHAGDLWTKEEVYRFYARTRRETCTFTQLMDLWLLVPLCEGCIQGQWWYRGAPPNVFAGTWEVDLVDYLDETAVRRIRHQLKRDEEPAGIRCWGRCGREIKPWNGDDLFVERRHVEEHYGVDLETPGRVRQAKNLRNQIILIYDKRCFNCAARSGLHIDHIRPRSKGGDAAFRNLQPLCNRCGDRKGDTEPEEVTVYSTMYFTEPPSDGFEGIFWE